MLCRSIVVYEIALDYRSYMPTILIIRGYRFFFVSLDRGEPVHVHVEKGDSYAKYWLKPLRLARSRGFRQHELTELRRLVQKHEKLFVSQWNAFFSVE